MVNSLGGIYLDFPMPVKDAYSGLNITKTGCQLVNGSQALALVRSRHLYYFENGTWNADVQSDFSRIQRQDVFFRSMITRAHEKVTDPLSINAFIGALALTSRSTVPSRDSCSGSPRRSTASVSTASRPRRCPTTEYVNSGGADVLQAAQPYAATDDRAVQRLRDDDGIGLEVARDPPKARRTDPRILDPRGRPER